MDAPAACEIERLPDTTPLLPEDLLVHVISLTSPADAFRATAVSRAFHAAADSDTVWSRLLPRDLLQFARREIPRKPPSTKKGMFRRLSGEPALLPAKYVRMQLDKATGAKCFTLSASALQANDSHTPLIRVGTVPGYSKRGKRFSEAGELGYGILKIRAKIQKNMLSQNTTYVAYMVLKLGPRFHGFDFPFQEASFGVAGSESVRKVCLQGYVEDADKADDPPRKHIMPSYYLNRDAVPPGDDVVFPRKTADDWMEVEFGEFHNKGGDGDVSISLTETTEPKSGLIVWGIVIRSKQTNQKKKKEVSKKGK
ncbi:F-box protein PP2-B11 [Triticum aestivum]|uniref:F-box protein PP2-B11 n=1 Tax=Triticum aestivum TaxID=4565 RepID=UPI001D0229C0|nr:F-box protein PP2-B11-like [Triticum aestivum]